MAAQMTLEEMRKSLGVDSLGFLSVEGLYHAMGETKRNAADPQFTDHAFTGEYPTTLTDHSSIAPRRISNSRCWRKRRRNNSSHTGEAELNSAAS
jgi:amidophosphoribosyltransferase